MTDPLTALNAIVKSVDEIEADYRRKLDQLNDLGATDAQIATVAIQRKVMMVTALIPPSFPSGHGPFGTTPADLATAAVDALRHCGRLAGP